MKKRNLIPVLEKYIDTMDKADRMCKEIMDSTEAINVNVINDFKPFIEPKKNIENLLCFFESFKQSKDIIEENQSKIYEIAQNNLEKLSDKDIIILQKKGMLLFIESINKELAKLDDYGDVRIARDLIDVTKDFVKKCTKYLEKSFFNSIKTNMSDAEELSKSARFFLSQANNKNFLSKYSSTVYSLYNYDGELDRDMILEAVKEIEDRMVNMIQLNEKILGPNVAKNLNNGLVKLLIISIKKCLADVLMTVEKNDLLEDVPFLIKINASIKHKRGEIKDIEEIFVFKDEINKIVCNILLSFLNDVNKIENPDKFCDIEKLNLDLKRTFDEMREHKETTKAFIRKFGPFFKINKYDQIFEKFGFEMLNKVFELSEKLKGLKKAIYLSNNVYTLGRHLSVYNGKNLDNLVDSFLEDIVNAWKNELESKSNRKFTQFIDSNLKAQASYYLPEELREKVIPKIKFIIWENVSKKGYSGDETKINGAIENLFTAS